MAEVAALPPLLPPASPPPPPPPLLATDNAAAMPAQPSSPGRAATRLPVFQWHTASSRSHALVDPESETAGEIRALMRREVAPLGGRLPQLGAGGAADYVRHGGDDLRELVARKRQVQRCCSAVDACECLRRGNLRQPCPLLYPREPPSVDHQARLPTSASHACPAALQIFLAQMSLDTKHNEIAKLEQRAHQREEALLVGACCRAGLHERLAWAKAGLGLANSCAGGGLASTGTSSWLPPLVPLHAGRGAGAGAGLAAL